MSEFPSLNFQILENNNLAREFSVQEDVLLTVGRDPSCNIAINHPRISRNHATITVRGGQVYITDNGSANKTFINGVEMDPHKQYPLTEDTAIQLATGEYAIKVRFRGRKPPGPNGGGTGGNIQELLRRNGGQALIGRGSDCQIRLDSLRVSRRHALVEERADGLYLTDLDSKNGTFVNGERISGTVKLRHTDTVTISSYQIELAEGSVTDLKDVGFAIVAERIEKKYPNGKVGLQEMSIKVPAKCFVALMGPSGCGKSTLLKGLNGANPVSQGSVLINGLPLNKKNFNYLRRNIGYVPQDDIVHRELTVDKTLYYAAKLRMADDVSREEIEGKIEEVLDSLNINTPDIRKNKVGALSGGQRKRVSIAVELLHDPTILFLDEPTSPLDPETIGDFLDCIRGLSRNGVTTVMVTHKPSDLGYVDQVIFLAAGGYLAYFGDKSKLLPHFDSESLINVYSLLKMEDTGKKWYNRWREKNPVSSAIPAFEGLSQPRTESFLKQYYWLSRRYFDIKWSDKGNILLLLAQPIVIASLICFIFNTGLEVGVLFLVAVSAIWFGVSNAAKEIVGEIPIYERERMFNMSIWSYLLSKITVLSLIALVQIFIFMAIIFFGYSEWNVPEEFSAVVPRGFANTTFFVFYLSASATLFGLVLSSLFRTTEKVMTVVPIALIPQIMLAGVVAKIDNGFKELLSYLTLGRWGTEGLGRIQDDLARGETEVFYRSDSTRVYQSVLSPEPEFQDTSLFCPGIDSIPMQKPTGEMVSHPDEALRVLSLYGEGTLGLIPDEPTAPLMAITALNVLCVLAVYLALKSKDKIQ